MSQIIITRRRITSLISDWMFHIDYHFFSKSLGAFIDSWNSEKEKKLALVHSSFCILFIWFEHQLAMLLTVSIAIGCAICVKAHWYLSSFFFFFIPWGSKLFFSSLMLYHPLPKEENVWKNNIKVLLLRFQHTKLLMFFFFNIW